jgi:hypothetical protein
MFSVIWKMCCNANDGTWTDHTVLVPENICCNECFYFSLLCVFCDFINILRNMDTLCKLLLSPTTSTSSLHSAVHTHTRAWQSQYSSPILYSTTWDQFCVVQFPAHTSAQYSTNVCTHCFFSIFWTHPAPPFLNLDWPVFCMLYHQTDNCFCDILTVFSFYQHSPHVCCVVLYPSSWLIFFVYVIILVASLMMQGGYLFILLWLF